ncbi:MAG: hypothetical protein AAF468_19895 [Pseudomonadota bacterium]
MDFDLGLTRKIIAEAKDMGILRNQLAYILATAFWETGRTMRPVKEAHYLGPRAEAWRRKNLRYWPWYGRGLVQLTWERNYIRAGKKLGRDFTINKDDVMEDDATVKILLIGSMEGWFTGKKIGDYITLQKSDFVNARRVINGRDKAHAIAEIARDYDRALKREGYGETDTPAFQTRHEKVAVDAAATDRSSTTTIAAGVGAATTIATTAKQIAEPLGDVKSSFDVLISLGPWFLLAIIGMGAAWWIWRERKRKAGEAREALDDLELAE